VKDILGYEGRYAVTTNGRIWSYPKDVTVGNNGGIRRQVGQWLSPTLATSKRGHLRVYLARDGIKTPVLVHRAVAFTYLPNPHAYIIINHIDGNSANNEVSNLEWCDAQHNSQHAYRTGLTTTPNQKGAHNSGAKLTEADVMAIRSSSHTITILAEQFGVAYATVRDIKSGRSWKHL
jgi:hypothetical protein